MNSFIFESGPLANRYQGSSRMYKKDKETVDDFFFVVYYVYYTNFKILYELQKVLCILQKVLCILYEFSNIIRIIEGKVIIYKKVKLLNYDLDKKKDTQIQDI